MESKGRSAGCHSRGYDLSRRCTRTTAGTTRIRMLLTRASGTLMASRLGRANNSAPKSWVVKRPWLAETLVSHDGLPRLRKSQTRVGPNRGLVTCRVNATTVASQCPMGYTRALYSCRPRGGPKESFLPFFVGRTKNVRSGKIVENCAWPNLDAMSVPEALVYSILHHFAQGIRIKHP